MTERIRSMRQVVKWIAMPLALAVGLASAAAAQTADELVAKNLKAKGGVERLKALQGMRISGRVSLPGANAGPSASGGLEIPMTIITKRPNRFRQESTVQGQKVVAAFDGSKAWMINPIMGSDKPQEITGDRLEMVKQQADLDGPLVDYKAKGTTVELAGTDTVDGKPVHKLKVTPKSGRVVYLYLDDQTGLEAKTVMEVPADESGGQPGGATLESLFSNYQSVGGLMMPHTIQQKAAGQVMQINIDKIELSPQVDDSIFAMPGAPAATGPSPR
jgi:outer membrane lipoprotein-sorting protein